MTIFSLCLRLLILISAWFALQVKINKGKGASVRKLVDCLYRSDKEHWPKTFHLALEQADYYEASDLWNWKEGAVQVICHRVWVVLMFALLLQALKRGALSPSSVSFSCKLSRTLMALYQS